MPLPPKATVYDRAMKTGAMAGPNNPLVNQLMMKPPGPGPDSTTIGAPMEEGGMPPKAPGASPAPNYRNAEDMEMCNNCARFEDADHYCNKYDFVANPTKVCDGYEESAPGPEAPPPPPPGPPAPPLGGPGGPPPGGLPPLPPRR